MSERRWPCPHCGESIPVVAQVCRFCGKPPGWNPAIQVVRDRFGNVSGATPEDHVLLQRVLSRSRALSNARTTEPSSDPSTTPETPPEDTREAKRTTGLPPDELTSTMRDILTGAVNLKAFE